MPHWYSRNKKGEVVKEDEETRPIARDKPIQTPSAIFDDESSTTPPPVPPAAQEDETRIIGTEVPLLTETPPDTSDAMSDPVIGWLVIIQGPGQGHALQLGYGQNSIGRSVTERVSINFGDQEISREQHCIITYDPRGRKYYISNGNGTNLAYLNEAPVIAPIELMGAEIIGLGQTTCRFVPLCGADFDWQELKNTAYKKPPC